MNRRLVSRALFLAALGLSIGGVVASGCAGSQAPAAVAVASPADPRIDAGCPTCGQIDEGGFAISTSGHQLVALAWAGSGNAVTSDPRMMEIWAASASWPPSSKLYPLTMTRTSGSTPSCQEWLDSICRADAGAAPGWTFHVTHVLQGGFPVGDRCHLLEHPVRADGGTTFFPAGGYEVANDAGTLAWIYVDDVEYWAMTQMIGPEPVSLTQRLPDWRDFPVFRSYVCGVGHPTRSFEPVYEGQTYSCSAPPPC